MPCCCINTLNLCNVPVCGILELPVAASAQSGESGEVNNYSLIIDYLGTEIVLTEAQTEGENVAFNISALNENFQYTAKLYNSAGELVSITNDETVYDCIKFKTIQRIGITAQQQAAAALSVVVVEAFVGDEVVITGSSAAVIGLEAGSSSITCFEFANKRVTIVRGAVTIPGIEPDDASNYFTKDLASNTILLSAPLIEGEFIRIETIL